MAETMKWSMESKPEGRRGAVRPEYCRISNTWNLVIAAWKLQIWAYRGILREGHGSIWTVGPVNNDTDCDIKHNSSFPNSTSGSKSVTLQTA